MGTFSWQREGARRWAIYDLRLGHELGQVATVHDADYLDTILAALERAHGRNSYAAGPAGPQSLPQAPAAAAGGRHPSDDSA